MIHCSGGSKSLRGVVIREASRLKHLFDDARDGLNGFIKLRGVFAAGFRQVFAAAAGAFHVSRRLLYDLAGVELGGEVFRHGARLVRPSHPRRCRATMNAGCVSSPARGRDPPSGAWQTAVAGRSRDSGQDPRYKRNCHYISRLSEGWEKIGLQHLFDDAGHGLDGFIKLRGVLAAGFRQVFTAAARTFHVSRRLLYDLAGVELGGEVFRHGGDE